MFFSDLKYMKTILFAGHDLKFIKTIVNMTDSKYNVIIDKWNGHFGHNKQHSHKLLCKADIIFCEWCLGNAVWYSHRVKKNQKLIVRIHKQELYTEFINKVKWKNVYKVIFIAPKMKEIGEKKIPEIKDKSVLIYNYLDKKFFTNIKKSNHQYNLGMLGYVPYIKRLDKAIEIYRKLKKKDKRYKLYIKGKHPDDVPWLKKRDVEMDYFKKMMRIVDSDKDIIVSGFDNQVDVWFQKVGWILSTSDIEGSHQAIAEGMATGCIPIITGGFVEEYGAGLIYPKKFCHSVVPDSIKWNIKISKECHEYVKRFHINRIFKQYLKLFNI